jgi:hypothetical protein
MLVAEATPAFVEMTKLCCFSLRTRAGALAEAPIGVIFNDREDPAGAAFLRERLNVRVEVMPRVDTPVAYLNKFNFLKSSLVREVDWVVFLDCDTIVNQPLDELLPIMADESVGFIGAPDHKRQAWRLERIWARELGVRPESLDHLRHPWHLAGLPVFNIGVFALRTRHAAELDKVAIPTILRYYQAQTTSKLRPLHYLQYKWNRRFWKRPDAERWIIGSHYPRVHGAQIALPIILHKLGVKMHTLPHGFNWHRSAPELGDDGTIRVLHYLKNYYPLDKPTMLTPPPGAALPAWIGERENDPSPGWRALAEMARAFVTAHAPGTRRPTVTARIG